uniref:hypothetical protein n=1 Tax=Vibrio anguillarum TaxID=55601 RepID=UPI001BE45E75
LMGMHHIDDQRGINEILSRYKDDHLEYLVLNTRVDFIVTGNIRPSRVFINKVQLSESLEQTLIQEKWACLDRLSLTLP